MAGEDLADGKHTQSYFLRDLVAPLGFSRWLSALPAVLLGFRPVRLSFSTLAAIDATLGLVTFFAITTTSTLSQRRSGVDLTLLDGDPTLDSIGCQSSASLAGTSTDIPPLRPQMSQPTYEQPLVLPQFSQR